MFKKLLVFFYVTQIVATSVLNAYESEDKVKAVIIGKLAKYIKWEDKKEDNDFIITVLNNPYDDLFDKVYAKKKIQGKQVKIDYIDDISQLKNPHILYIPKTEAAELSPILNVTSDKNILTVSDIRGFAEKQGIVQVYFASQKAKLKINVDAANKQNLKIKSSLLNIAEVVKEEK